MDQEKRGLTKTEIFKLYRRLSALENRLSETEKFAEKFAERVQFALVEQASEKSGASSHVSRPIRQPNEAFVIEDGVSQAL